MRVLRVLPGGRPMSIAALYPSSRTVDPETVAARLADAAQQIGRALR